MVRVALVTANFGGIDSLKPLPEHPGVDCFCYSDCDFGSNPDAASWDRVITCNYPRHDFSPRLKSRYFKHQIHRLDEVQAHDYLVWADSSLRFHRLDFVLEFVRRLQQRPPQERVLAIPHPDRATVVQEYEFIRGEIQRGNEYLRIRYADEKMDQQMQHFRSQGWNIDARLWCGTFWIVENSELFRRAWDDWWDQNVRFGMMDQLSLPVIFDKHRIQPAALDVPLWQNEYFSLVPHRALM